MQLQLQPPTRGNFWKGFRLCLGHSIGLSQTSPMPLRAWEAKPRELAGRLLRVIRKKQVCTANLTMSILRFHHT